jgi:vacuolar iron transporter family protein
MWIRDAVFGVQDGLLSTMGALTGIAAGTQDRTVVLISGLVIIAVESLSMAAGSYVSSKSHREYLERLLKEEQETIVRNPEGERRELHAMYRERGYSDPEIAIVERRLFSSPELLLEDMAHKELGICPRTFEEPAGNALVMGSSYVAGGLIPVLPYTFLSLTMAVAVSISVTFAALFALGGWKGRLVRRGIWRSGLEMVGMAGLAALAGYGIGRLAKGWL